MGSNQTKVKVVKMRLRNGKEYYLPNDQGEVEAGPSSMSQREDLPMIVHRTQTNESESGAIVQSVVLHGNSQLIPSRERRGMIPFAEMQNNQSVGRASFLRFPSIYTGNGILRIICLIPSLLGIIGGINAIMEYIYEPDVIVHEVHLIRQHCWLTNLFQGNE